MLIENVGIKAKRIEMKHEKTWLSCREAAVLLDCSQRHILNLIKKGKFSAVKDEDGRYCIEKSEFFRAYPELMHVEVAGNGEKSSGNTSVKVLEERIKHLQEMVNEKNKQNEFLLGQLEINTDEKSKMLDAINNHARLLEFKETGSKVPSSSHEKKGFAWWPFKRK